VLEHLMTHGQKVAEGDRLAKTILFAKNQAHARFIVERFDKAYPHHAGAFARVIISSDSYAQSLIEDFSQPEKAPHLAVSVDMLDTGIDVPEVANLVFFKVVRSKAKFWQMLGPRHAPAAGPVRAGAAQGVLLGLRLLPEPGVLQPEPGRGRGGDRRLSVQAPVRGAGGADQRLGRPAPARRLRGQRSPEAVRPRGRPA
jgi:hypothetical protein